MDTQTISVLSMISSLFLATLCGIWLEIRAMRKQLANTIIWVEVLRASMDSLPCRRGIELEVCSGRDT